MHYNLLAFIYIYLNIIKYYILLVYVIVLTLTYFLSCPAEGGADHYDGTDPGLQHIRVRSAIPQDAFVY